jgi:hypothetical protein
MVLVLESGEGLELSNSYIDLVYTYRYLNERYKEAFNRLNDTDKNLYLITASSFIDNVFNWKGERTHTLQAMAFPRRNIDYDGNEYPTNKVPEQVRRACMVALYQLLDNGLDTYKANAQFDLLYVKKEKVGPMETEFFNPTETGLRNNNVSEYEDLNRILKGFYKEDILKNNMGGGTVSVDIIRD